MCFFTYTIVFYIICFLLWCYWILFLNVLIFFCPLKSFVLHCKQIWTTNWMLNCWCSCSNTILCSTPAKSICFTNIIHIGFYCSIYIYLRIIPCKDSDVRDFYFRLKSAIHIVLISRIEQSKIVISESKWPNKIFRNIQIFLNKLHTNGQMELMDHICYFF